MAYFRVELLFVGGGVTAVARCAPQQLRLDCYCCWWYFLFCSFASRSPSMRCFFLEIFDVTCAHYCCCRPTQSRRRFYRCTSQHICSIWLASVSHYFIVFNKKLLLCGHNVRRDEKQQIHRMCAAGMEECFARLLWSGAYRKCEWTTVRGMEASRTAR